MMTYCFGLWICKVYFDKFMLFWSDEKKTCRCGREWSDYTIYFIDCAYLLNCLIFLNLPSPSIHRLGWLFGCRGCKEKQHTKYHGFSQSKLKWMHVHQKRNKEFVEQSKTLNTQKELKSFGNKIKLVLFLQTLDMTLE